MKERLRALASRLTARRVTSRATPSDDPSIQLLIEADDLLERARELAASLAKSEDAGRWDELDDIVGRLVLRDVTLAVARLRHLAKRLDADLTHADSVVRPLGEAINKVEVRLIQSLLRSATRKAETTKLR